MEPLPYWHAADTADRQGMAETRHIEGLYAFWDDLLKRHPNLIIDNCASGGRRIDLETHWALDPLLAHGRAARPDRPPMPHLWPDALGAPERHQPGSGG